MIDSLHFYIFSSFVNFLTSFVIAFFVLIKSKKLSTNRYFAYFTFCISFWSLFYFLWLSTTNPVWSDYFIRTCMIGVILISPTFIQFSTSFVKIKLPSFFHILNYLLGFTFILFIYTPFFAVIGEDFLIFREWPRPGLLFHLAIIYFGVNVIFGHTLLVYKYFKTEERIVKNQILFVLLGGVFGFFGGSVNFLPWYRIPVLPVTTILVSLWAPLVSYAIFRYRLMDIRLMFKRTMAYSLAAGLLTAFFAILVITTTNLLSTYANVSSLKVSIFAALVIAILFNPLRSRIQVLIDKVFYKKTYDYYATIGKITKELESLFDVDRIYNFIGEIIYSTFGLDNIYILTADHSMGTFETVNHLSRKDKNKQDKLINESEAMTLRSDSELIRLLERSQKIIVKDELLGWEKDFGLDIVEKVKKELVEYGIDAAVPIFVDRKLTLVLTLGEKSSGEFFSNEDINLMNTIANQTAIAIKNAGLYKEKVESERMASIGMMSATFAHEVRNPLTSLKTFAQLMPEKYNDAEFRDYFSKIVEGEIDRIDGLIRDLLDFSTEKKSSRSNNFNLVSLVDETVNYVKGKLDFEKKHITIEKNYGNSAIEMSGDASNLKQAFINIITNGCQAMNAEGTLKVHILPNGGNIDVAITDTGEGIHPDDIANIFDPFVTTKEMGIGLGLAISKRIVEDHKGSINVKSQLSKGTTFTISLPVQN